MLEKCHHFQGFPQAIYTWGGFALPDIGGGQSINGGTHKGRETQTLWGGGPNSDRLYHKLKVLQLLLSCNYTMQFVSYCTIPLNLVDLYLIVFKFAQ